MPEETLPTLISSLVGGGINLFVILVWWLERREAKTERRFYRSLSYQLLVVLLMVTINDDTISKSMKEILKQEPENETKINL